MRLVFSCFSLALVCAACPEGDVGSSEVMMQEARASCPMVVAGSSVELAEVDDGVALEFTTDEDVAELRSRVETMSEMYRRHAGHPRMMWHRFGEGGPNNHHRPGMLRSAMPPVRAEVESIPRGARIILRPEDPADLPRLHEHLRVHRDRMQAGQCWSPTR